MDGHTVHQVGMPWHFGSGGLAQGGVANNLTSLVADPNSRIHEGKSFTCNIRKGRIARPVEGLGAEEGERPL